MTILFAIIGICTVWIASGFLLPAALQSVSEPVWSPSRRESLSPLAMAVLLGQAWLSDVGPQSARRWTPQSPWAQALA